MRYVYFPNTFTEKKIKEAKKSISETLEKMPEASDDFILVDEIGGEINIKFFKPEGIMEICVIENITPKEFLMAVMREQNSKIN